MLPLSVMLPGVRSTGLFWNNKKERFSLEKRSSLLLEKLKARLLFADKARLDLDVIAKIAM